MNIPDLFSKKWFSGSAIDKIDFSEPNDKEVFHILLIKPTRYDEEGYPIQWYRSLLPCNSLACMHGIAKDTASRNVLGTNVEIRVSAFYEPNEAMNYGKLVTAIQNTGHKALIALVGVQSNQFPRAIDIAKPFLNVGMPVGMGGFHISGSVSMLEGLPEELVMAQNMGISLFAGEAEDFRFDKVVCDCYHGNMPPLYDYSGEMVDLAGQPLPYLPYEMVKRNLSATATIDLGRGCPFNCSFCCIINVQGRKSRSRSTVDMEAQIRNFHEMGIATAFITDDDFARNSNWEAYFDKFIELRDEGIRMSLIIQVDTLCHKIPGFIDKAVKAGVVHVFVGLENINPVNLKTMNKKQNKISEYRKMLLEWKRHPTVIWGAYIIGLPDDTRESVLHDIDIIKRELPIDLFNPSIITPLPGSQDHVNMLAKGGYMDPDLNNYDLAHRVIHHQSMSDAELDALYIEVWDRYYTFDHMVTILKRMFALGSDKINTTVERLIAFGVSTRAHNIRSYDMGLVRRKSRLSRRDNFVTEPFFIFHAKHIYTTIRNLLIIVAAYYRLVDKMKKIQIDPQRDHYMDLAITPVSNSEYETFELYKPVIHKTIHNEKIHQA